MTTLASFAVDPAGLDVQGGLIFDPSMVFCHIMPWNCFTPTLPEFPFPGGRFPWHLNP